MTDTPPVEDMVEGADTSKMDKSVRKARAEHLLNDDILSGAFKEIKATIIKELLAATTSEDRDQKWHEYHALERARRALVQWAKSPQE